MAVAERCAATAMEKKNIPNGRHAPIIASRKRRVLFPLALSLPRALFCQTCRDRFFLNKIAAGNPVVVFKLAAIETNDVQTHPAARRVVRSKIPKYVSKRRTLISLDWFTAICKISKITLIS